MRKVFRPNNLLKIGLLLIGIIVFASVIVYNISEEISADKMISHMSNSEFSVDYMKLFIMNSYWIVLLVGFIVFLIITFLEKLIIDDETITFNTKVYKKTSIELFDGDYLTLKSGEKYKIKIDKLKSTDRLELLTILDPYLNTKDKKFDLTFEE